MEYAACSSKLLQLPKFLFGFSGKFAPLFDDKIVGLFRLLDLICLFVTIAEIEDTISRSNPPLPEKRTSLANPK